MSLLRSIIILSNQCCFSTTCALALELLFSFSLLLRHFLYRRDTAPGCLTTRLSQIEKVFFWYTYLVSPTGYCRHILRRHWFFKELYCRNHYSDHLFRAVLLVCKNSTCVFWSLRHYLQCDTDSSLHYFNCHILNSCGVATIIFQFVSFPIIFLSWTHAGKAMNKFNPPLNMSG